MDVRDVPVVSRPSSATSSAGCDEPRPSTSSQSSAESRPLEAPQTGQVQHRMFCTICKKCETSGTFVTGSTNFKVESINFHGKSASHRGNAARAKAKLATPGTSIAEKSLIQLNDSVYLHLSRLFRTAHALAKHGRPFSDFSWQCDMDQAKGLDIGRCEKQACHVRAPRQ